MKKGIQYVHLGDSLASICKVEASGKACLDSIYDVEQSLDFYAAAVGVFFKKHLADVAALRAKLTSDEDGEVHQLSTSDCRVLYSLLLTVVKSNRMFHAVLTRRKRYTAVARVASTVGFSIFATLSGLSIASLTPLAIPSMPIALAGVLLAVGTVGVALSGLSLWGATKMANNIDRDRNLVKAFNEDAKACRSAVSRAYEAGTGRSLQADTMGSGSPVAAAAMKPSAACTAPRASAAAAESAVGSPAPAVGQG